MKNVLLLCIATIILASCAGFTQVTTPASSIVYTGKDLETQRHVKYRLTKTYVFGIGGMSRKARNTNVVDEMIKKAQLQNNETLAYITTSRNINTFLGIFTEVNYEASAYVVRPVEGKYVNIIGEYEGKDTDAVVETVMNKIDKVKGAREFEDMQDEINALLLQGKITEKDARQLHRIIHNKFANGR